MIELKNISFSYDGQNDSGLCGLSLNIPKGQCVLLCGGSGCGKTTITRLMNGLIPHFFSGELSGQVLIDGKNTGDMDAASISDVVGSVFQNPRTQFFNTDTDSEIVFGLENRAVSQDKLKQRLYETVSQLGLESLLGRSIFELSGGEKQKIAFASVYATSPDVFVLDEPSSNLDVQAIHSLALLLKKIKAEGKTIVVAEHRLWYLMDIADRVILMRDGQIQRDMTAEEFKSIPEDELPSMGLRCRSLEVVKTEHFQTVSTNSQLTVKNLSVKLGRTEIFRELNFSLNGGEIVALAGQNGMGKTTLARTLCGLQKAVRGQILMNGVPVSEKPRRKAAYMVMQDVNHQLFTDSVTAECALGVKNAKPDLVNQALSQFDLSQFRDRHPLSLSGGQKQRLAIAVSLLCGKELLVFDEPTSGLDLKSMLEVGQFARELSAQGKVLLIITHDYEFIQSICSRVLVLKDGTIAADLRGNERAGVYQHMKGKDL